ncbi:MAG: porin family protein, partial [Nitrospirota bacterium]|nr:porin family protein [Nitrospirota bacterium]
IIEMRKILAALVIFSAVTAAGPSFAELFLQKHTWEVGAGLSYVTYKEPGVMKEEGAKAGLFGSYTYHERFMFRTEAELNHGQMDYRGSGTIDDIPNYMFEVRLLAGRDIPVAKRSIVTPYAGFGYRYLNDDSSYMISSTDHIGYERESNYYYSPIGVETLTELDNGWKAGVRLEYDHFWKGKQISKMGYVPGYHDIENNQDGGYGVRGSVRFINRKSFVYVIEPFIRYWDIEDSDLDDGWYEPKNNSTEFGLRFSSEF